MTNTAPLLPFLISFRPRPSAKVRTWLRFAESFEKAVESAKRVIAFETCDRGELVSVEAAGQVAA